MSDIFYIKQGSELPEFINLLSTPAGAIDLTGASVVLRLKRRGSLTTVDKIGTPFVDQTGADKGKVRVPGVAFDALDVPLISGCYYAETRITFPDTSVAIFPGDIESLYDYVVILPSL